MRLLNLRKYIFNKSRGRRCAELRNEAQEQEEDGEGQCPSIYNFLARLHKNINHGTQQHNSHTKHDSYKIGMNEQYFMSASYVWALLLVITSIGNCSAVVGRLNCNSSDDVRKMHWNFNTGLVCYLGRSSPLSWLLVFRSLRIIIRLLCECNLLLVLRCMPVKNGVFCCPLQNCNL